MSTTVFREIRRSIAILLTTLAIQFSLPIAQAADNSNVIYHIFVRSFCDSDEPASTTSRGDLDGITSKLDSYLNDGNAATDHDLGVGILWLMPIFPSDSYHGYNVRDYTAINSDYGTLADFDELIAAAKSRGVQIIIDLPMNHTSKNHPWFQQAIHGDAEMRKRYFFRDADQPLTFGWHSISTDDSDLQYFGLFDSSMPDLNFDNPLVKADIKKIAKFWLDRGVDGFRIDAAKHVYGDTFSPLTESQTLNNNQWWLDFSNYCYSLNPNAILVGEVLGKEEEMRRHSYGLEALLDAEFLHGARRQIVSPKAGFIAQVKARLETARGVNDNAGHVPNRRFEYVPFIGSHDENPRLASMLDKLKADEQMSASVDAAYRLAIYLLMTMGDMPVIYNGDELMQRGLKWDGSGDGSRIYDETLREPFPWYKSGDGPGQTRWFKPRYDGPNDSVSVEEQIEPNGMLSLVRELVHYRSRHASLSDGEFGEILRDAEDSMVFQRRSDGDELLVMINLTGVSQNFVFNEGWFPQYVNAGLQFWSDGQVRTWKDLSLTNETIGETITVPPYGLVILKKS